MGTFIALIGLLLATVAGSLDRLIKKEKITAADKEQALARIKTSTSYDDLQGTQLVIEAARAVLSPLVLNRLIRRTKTSGSDPRPPG